MSQTRPTILLVHGFPGGASDFTLLTGALVDRGWSGEQILAPDLIGFGELTGEPTFDQLWIPAQARRLAALLADVGDVVLVGHDVGGPVALAVAAHLGPRVRGVVVASCNVLRDPPLPGPFRALGVPGIGAVVEAMTMSRTSLRAMGRVGRRSGPAPRRNTPAEVRAIRTLFATALRDPARHFGPVEDDIRAGGVDPVFVTGDQDPFFSVAHARRQAALAPSGRLVVLPRVGHFPHLEAPSALAEIISERAGRRRLSSPGLRAGQRRGER